MVTIANHNLGPDLLTKVNNQEWMLFKIAENPELLNETNDSYFFTEDSKYRSFKNKVMIETVNGRKHNAHIIHLVKSEGWGCITLSDFWDQFNEKGKL